MCDEQNLFSFHGKEISNFPLTFYQLELFRNFWFILSFQFFFLRSFVCVFTSFCGGVVFSQFHFLFGNFLDSFFLDLLQPLFVFLCFARWILVGDFPQNAPLPTFLCIGFLWYFELLGFHGILIVAFIWETSFETPENKNNITRCCQIFLKRFERQVNKQYSITTLTRYLVYNSG